VIGVVVAIIVPVFVTVPVVIFVQLVVDQLSTGVIIFVTVSVLSRRSPVHICVQTISALAGKAKRRVVAIKKIQSNFLFMRNKQTNKNLYVLCVKYTKYTLRFNTK